MKTIALSIQKGGVGKTSLAVSLAAELTRETGSVLLIDLDPQGNASNWIGPREMSAELADVLFGKVALEAVSFTSIPPAFTRKSTSTSNNGALMRKKKKTHPLRATKRKALYWTP
jgi:chromosome partitioning protein